VFIEKPEFFSGVTFMLNRFLLNWSINNSKAIITVSEDTRKKIQNNLNRKANVHIVYNCYPSIFYDYHFPELLKVDVPFVLYFGGSDPRKNLSLMFKIFEIYKDKAKGNLKLLCTKFREDYEIFLEDTQQLHRDIDFLGEISPEHLINKIIYSKAIFYLSDYEGFGRPVMEAAAFDKPIITKNLDVFKEITNANTLIVEDIDSGVNILKQLEKVSGLKSKYSISLNPKFLTSSNVLRFQNVVKQYIEINNGI
jgi:glycosyltransferase involved in cell wall biosynthesis